MRGVWFLLLFIVLFGCDFRQAVDKNCGKPGNCQQPINLPDTGVANDAGVRCEESALLLRTSASRFPWTTPQNERIFAIAGSVVQEAQTLYWSGLSDQGTDYKGRLGALGRQPQGYNFADVNCYAFVDGAWRNAHPDGGILLSKGREAVTLDFETRIAAYRATYPSQEICDIAKIDGPIVRKLANNRFVLFFGLDNTFDTLFPDGGIFADRPFNGSFYHNTLNRLGIAVSNSPCGDYTYLGSIRPAGFSMRNFRIAEADSKLFLLFRKEEITPTVAVDTTSRWIAGEIDTALLQTATQVDDTLIQNSWTLYDDYETGNAAAIAIQAAYAEGNAFVFLIRSGSPALGWGNDLREFRASTFQNRTVRFAELKAASSAKVCKQGRICASALTERNCVRDQKGDNTGAPGIGTDTCQTSEHDVFTLAGSSSVFPNAKTTFLIGETDTGFSDYRRSSPVWTPLFSEPLAGGAFPNELADPGLNTLDNVNTVVSPWTLSLDNVNGAYDKEKGSLTLTPGTALVNSATLSQKVNLVGERSYDLNFTFTVSAEATVEFGVRGPGLAKPEKAKAGVTPFQFRLPGVCSSEPWEVFVSVTNLASSTVVVSEGTLTESTLGSLTRLETPVNGRLPRWSVTKSGRVIIQE